MRRHPCGFFRNYQENLTFLLIFPNLHRNSYFREFQFILFVFLTFSTSFFSFGLKFQTPLDGSSEATSRLNPFVSRIVSNVTTAPMAFYGTTLNNGFILQQIGYGSSASLRTTISVCNMSKYHCSNKCSKQYSR